MESISSAFKIAAILRIHLLSLILKLLMPTTIQINASCRRSDSHSGIAYPEMLSIISVKSTASEPIQRAKLI